MSQVVAKYIIWKPDELSELTSKRSVSTPNGKLYNSVRSQISTWKATSVACFLVEGSLRPKCFFLQTDKPHSIEKHYKK